MSHLLCRYNVYAICAYFCTQHRRPLTHSMQVHAAALTLAPTSADDQQGAHAPHHERTPTLDSSVLRAADSTSAAHVTGGVRQLHRSSQLPPIPVPDLSSLPLLSRALARHVPVGDVQAASSVKLPPTSHAASGNKSERSGSGSAPPSGHPQVLPSAAHIPPAARHDVHVSHRASIDAEPTARLWDGNVGSETPGTAAITHVHGRTYVRLSPVVVAMATSVAQAAAGDDASSAVFGPTAATMAASPVIHALYRGRALSFGSSLGVSTVPSVQHVGVGGGGRQRLGSGSAQEDGGHAVHPLPPLPPASSIAALLAVAAAATPRSSGTAVAAPAAVPVATSSATVRPRSLSSASSGAGSATQAPSPRSDQQSLQ